MLLDWHSHYEQDLPLIVTTFLPVPDEPMVDICVLDGVTCSCPSLSNMRMHPYCQVLYKQVSSAVELHEVFP